jgi:hypothetical protein
MESFFKRHWKSLTVAGAGAIAGIISKYIFKAEDILKDNDITKIDDNIVEVIPTIVETVDSSDENK